jgi:hypothetical protein
MSTPREELHELVEQLPDEQVSAVLSDVKARLVPVRQERSWPPAWFAVAEGSSPDISARTEEILGEELGKRGA